MRNPLGVTLVRTTARKYSQRPNGADSRIAADATSNPPLGDIELLFVALNQVMRNTLDQGKFVGTVRASDRIVGVDNYALAHCGSPILCNVYTSIAGTVPTF